jgi:uncharacterized membrane protein
MTPNFTDLLIGPHLIGLLYILIGALQRYLPPKSPNRWYGYRTITAKTSQQTWDEANRYSAIYMMRAGAIVLVAGFIIYAGTMLMHLEDSTQKIINYTMLFGAAMGVGVLSTVATEKHLSRTFKKLNKPNRQSSFSKRK